MARKRRRAAPEPDLHPAFLRARAKPHSRVDPALRAVALAWVRESPEERTRNDIALAEKLGAAKTVPDAVPLLAEAKRRGWPRGGDWALPDGHPIKGHPNIFEALVQVEIDTMRPIAEKARSAAQGRARGTPRARADLSAQRSAANATLLAHAMDLRRRRGLSWRAIASFLEISRGRLERILAGAPPKKLASR